MSPFRSIKGRLLVLIHDLSRIPVISITTVYYYYLMGVVKSQEAALRNNFVRVVKAQEAALRNNFVTSAKAHTVEFMAGEKNNGAGNRFRRF